MPRYFEALRLHCFDAFSFLLKFHVRASKLRLLRPRNSSRRTGPCKHPGGQGIAQDPNVHKWSTDWRLVPLSIWAARGSPQTSGVRTDQSVGNGPRRQKAVERGPQFYRPGCSFSGSRFRETTHDVGGKGPPPRPGSPPSLLFSSPHLLLRHG